MANVPVDPFPNPLPGGLLTRRFDGQPPPFDIPPIDDFIRRMGGAAQESGGIGPSAPAGYIGPPVPIGPSPISVTGSDNGGIAPPVDPGRAAANLADIFAPAASQATSQGSTAPVVSTAGGPIPEASVPAPAAPSPSSQSTSYGGGGSGNINNWIAQLMDRFLNQGGMGDELRMDLRNQATQTGKVRERDRILRRGDDFAARGLFGSGLSKRGVQGIEAEESIALQGSLNEIEFQNAQMEAQSLRDAIGALNAQIQWKLGRGMLNVQREQLALQKLQHAEQMALAWAELARQKALDAAGDPGPGDDEYNGPGWPEGQGPLDRWMSDNPPGSGGINDFRDNNSFF